MARQHTPAQLAVICQGVLASLGPSAPGRSARQASAPTYAPASPAQPSSVQRERPKAEHRTAHCPLCPLSTCLQLGRPAVVRVWHVQPLAEQRCRAPHLGRPHRQPRRGSAALPSRRFRPAHRPAEVRRSDDAASLDGPQPARPKRRRAHSAVRWGPCCSCPCCSCPCRPTSVLNHRKRGGRGGRRRRRGLPQAPLN